MTFPLKSIPFPQQPRQPQHDISLNLCVWDLRGSRCCIMQLIVISHCDQMCSTHTFVLLKCWAKKTRPLQYDFWWCIPKVSINTKIHHRNTTVSVTILHQTISSIKQSPASTNDVNLTNSHHQTQTYFNSLTKPAPTHSSKHHGFSNPTHSLSNTNTLH